EGRMGYPSEKYEPNTITAVDKEEDKNIKPLISGLYNDGFQLNNEMRIVGAVFAFPRQFICWNTQAVETYNFLLSDERLVYGAFFPEKILKIQLMDYAEQ
ncbi:unnamed protein product, partial [Didymodactylos carnosus]